MGIVQSIKNIFLRSKYMVTTDTLTSIVDHPKIAVSHDEYARIQSNLTYYESKWDDVIYQNTAGEKKKRSAQHLPIARTVSKKLASLVYNEQAEITVNNAETNNFIQEVLLNDRFNKNFERYLESGLALGGLAMRPYIAGNRIRVAFIQAPVFLPLQSNTQDVSSAAIVTKTTKRKGKSKLYYTLIEFHEWDEEDYYVSNELYRSETPKIVGDRVPLSELYEDLKERVLVKNVSRPLFTYLKTPGMNNKDIDSPLGLSIFDNAKTTIDFLNTTYDEFMWEVKMGQRRIAVPDSMIKMNVQTEDGDIRFVQRFEAEQNVYQMLGTEEKGIGITDLTTPIRADDYIKAINEGLSLLEMQVGVSTGMFTFDGKSMKTATEIVSENSDTYQLRNSIVALVEQSMKELVVSICELAKGAELYDGDIPELKDIEVNLDDGIFTDRNAELDYWTKALASGIVSKEYAMKKVLGLADNELKEIIRQINQEKPSSSEVDEELYDE
ncbi:phage portal protein [Streptococcus suis]|uniref:phage portal protein n=1 Tax=Streptococcus suis TaxID=1307 RepID=UPI0024127567|nr:phage portal protein [Streptococcus suis]MDG4501422.1 phage portal protein [Streptococcus suis]